MAAKKPDHYSNGMKLMRQGVPTKVAPWVKELTAEGRKMIGQNAIMTPYSPRFREHLTKVAYTTDVEN